MDLQDIARRLASRDPAALEAAVADTHAADALAVPTGRPLSTFHPGTYSAAYVEFQFGDACPFLDRPVKISCEQVFAALPWREELEYSLPEGAKPYRGTQSQQMR